METFMKKVAITLCILTFITSSLTSAQNMLNSMSQGRNDHFSFDNIFDHARAQIERVETELKQALSAIPQESMPATIIGTKSVAPIITDEDQSVHISLKLAGINFENMVMKKVEGQNGIQLHVKIPLKNSTVELIITKETLTSALKHEAKEETEDENERSSISSFGISQIIQPLPSTVSLEDPQAEYDESKETLTISLKKSDITKSRLIPIKKK
jgi:hypothetical protein